MDETPENSLSFRHQHIISVLELRIQLQNEDFVIAENKAQQYITISSIILAIISGFSLGELSSRTPLIVRIFLTGLIFIFAFVLFHYLKALQHRIWKESVGTNEEEIANLKKRVTLGIDEAYYEFIFETHLKVILHNKEVLNTKRRHVNLARQGVRLMLLLTFIFTLIMVWLHPLCTLFSISGCI